LNLTAYTPCGGGLEKATKTKDWSYTAMQIVRQAKTGKKEREDSNVIIDASQSPEL